MSRKLAKTHNLIAKDLRTPKYKERVVETKRRKSKKNKKKLSPKEIEDEINFENPNQSES